MVFFIPLYLVMYRATIYVENFNFKISSFFANGQFSHSGSHFITQNTID